MPAQINTYDTLRTVISFVTMIFVHTVDLLKMLAEATQALKYTGVFAGFAPI